MTSLMRTTSKVPDRNGSPTSSTPAWTAMTPFEPAAAASAQFQSTATTTAGRALAAASTLSVPSPHPRSSIRSRALAGRGTESNCPNWAATRSGPGAPLRSALS